MGNCRKIMPQSAGRPVPYFVMSITAGYKSLNSTSSVGSIVLLFLALRSWRLWFSTALLQMQHMRPQYSGFASAGFSFRILKQSVEIFVIAVDEQRCERQLLQMVGAFFSSSDAPPLPAGFQRQPKSPAIRTTSSFVRFFDICGKGASRACLYLVPCHVCHL